MRKKAEGLSTVIPGDVLNFLAEKLTNNVRQMEGAIKRIIAFSRLNGEAITVALVNDCISDLLSTSNAVRLTPEKIISKVAEKYSISEADILGNKRTSNIMSARHISIYVIKKTLDLSFKAIGKLFQKDHATIMHSYKQTEKDIKNDSTFEIEINDFIKELSQ